MSNKDKGKSSAYHPNSIGSRIAELMLEKLTTNKTNDDATSNDQKGIQNKGKKK